MIRSESPTRVAALYDIHGNLPALRAVLDEVHRESVDLVVVGGDVVPGPMPRECLAALLSLATPVWFIRGNGENDVLALSRGEPLTRVPQRFHGVMRWSLDRLSAGQLAEIERWPGSCALSVPGLGDVLLCHATPRDDNEVFTELTPADRLAPLFADVGADVVVCGHTHMQFDRRIGNVRVVNVGSVGMPFGDPAACYALLGPDVELRAVAYDLDAAACEIEATGYPGLADLDLRKLPSAAEMQRLFEAVAIGQPGNSREDNR